MAHFVEHREEALIVVLDNATPAVEPQNTRGGVERTPAKCDATVLVDVRDGFGARSGGINVGAMGRVEDGERAAGHALGRDVDVFSPPWRRGNPEHGLLECPVPKVVLNAAHEIESRFAFDSRGTRCQGDLRVKVFSHAWSFQVCRDS